MQSRDVISNLPTPSQVCVTIPKAGINSINRDAGGYFGSQGFLIITVNRRKPSLIQQIMNNFVPTYDHNKDILELGTRRSLVGSTVFYSIRISYPSGALRVCEISLAGDTYLTRK
jgi:hypothetical protein